MGEADRPQPLHLEDDRQRKIRDHLSMPVLEMGGGVLGADPDLVGQIGIGRAVERSEHLTLAVAVHPDRAISEFGQPIERFGGHRAEGHVAVDDDGIDAGCLDLGQYGLQGRQVAMDVCQYRYPHGSPPGKGVRLSYHRDRRQISIGGY